MDPKLASVFESIQGQYFAITRSSLWKIIAKLNDMEKDAIHAVSIDAKYQPILDTIQKDLEIAHNILKDYNRIEHLVGGEYL